MNPIADWFRTMWPNPGRRRAVLSAYAELKAQPLLLADIALRGRVFKPFPPAATERQAGVAEGRRELALEIVRLSGMPFGELQRIVDEPLPRPESTPR